jgi:hypothetical protein
MPYFKQDYEDEDHFLCERVVEFRKRLASRPSESAEANPATSRAPASEGVVLNLQPLP